MGQDLRSYLDHLSQLFSKLLHFTEEMDTCHRKLQTLYTEGDGKDDCTMISALRVYIDYMRDEVNVLEQNRDDLISKLR